MRPTISLILLLAACGDPAFDRAVAALRAGRLGEAEAAAKESGHSEFLQGNVAFARCLLAERQASTPAAEPFAFDVAITYARQAQRFWQAAAMTRSDWPEARRNVERALLKIAELRAKKKKRENSRRTQPQPKPRPKPQPSGQPPGASKENPDLAPQLEALPAEDVARLFRKLAEKEREKRVLRRSRQKQRTAVERDW